MLYTWHPSISYDPNSGWGGLFILNSAININTYLIVDPDMIGSAEISSSDLFDIFGNQVEQFIHDQDHVTIDNATGNPQTRILQVTMNGKTAQKMIIVQ